MRSQRWEWLAIGILVGLWSLVIGLLAVSRHLAFNTGYDLGTFAQVVWATANGSPYYSSLTDGMTNFLGLHFTPLLALLAPLYRIWPDPRLLLVIQTIALAAAAIPLFAYGRPRLGFGLALVVVIAYLLSPLLHYISLFDFHSIALAVPLLMAAGVALLNRRPVATTIFLGMALFTKEEVALIAVGFGLYALLIQRWKFFGAVLTAGALLWTVLLFGLVMPALNQTPGGYVFLYRYASLGGTPGQVVRTLLTHPAKVVEVVTTKSKALFVWQLLAPLAFLPLLGLPAVLLTVPTLAYLLLSDYHFLTSIRYHYTAPLLPFLFLATVVAIQRLADRGRELAYLGGLALLVATLVTAWWWSPLPGARDYEPTSFAVTEGDRAAHRLLVTIPSEASVVSDWVYLPWLANRWRLETLLSPPQLPGESATAPDYVVAQRPGPGAISAPLYPWIVQDRPGQTVHVPRFAVHGTVSGDVTVWKALGSEHDVVLSRYEVPFEEGLVLVAAGTPPEMPEWGSVIEVEPGTTLPVWMAWGARRPLDRRITFTLHLVDDTLRPVTQVDQEMGAGRFPTNLWHEWMEEPLVVGEFRLPITPLIPPGRYRLLAGAYESESVIPLSRPDGGQWFELATVEVSP